MEEPSLTIFTTCCAGFSASLTSAPSALTHGVGELLDHRQRDIGVEQGEADVADRLVDVRLRETSLLRRLKVSVRRSGEAGEHRSRLTADADGPRPPTPSPRTWVKIVGWTTIFTHVRRGRRVRRRVGGFAGGSRGSDAVTRVDDEADRLHDPSRRQGQPVGPGQVEGVEGSGRHRSRCGPSAPRCRPTRRRHRSRGAARAGPWARTSSTVASLLAPGTRSALAPDPACRSTTMAGLGWCARRRSRSWRSHDPPARGEPTRARCARHPAPLHSATRRATR